MEAFLYGFSGCSAVLLVVAFLMYLDGKFSCKHKWKILSKEITESVLEQKSHLFARPGTVWPTDTDKYLIQIVTCSECGKIKKYKDKF